MAKEPFRFTTCATCGKQFIKTPGSIYKLRIKSRIKQFCCYTCYMTAKRTKENNK